MSSESYNMHITMINSYDSRVFIEKVFRVTCLFLSLTRRPIQRATKMFISWNDILYFIRNK